MAVASFLWFLLALTRYRARVAYDGSQFRGFQLQPSGRTVQGCLEEVLERRLQQPIRVVGAGRTDAGVHARGQAIHFDASIDDDNSLSSVEYSIQRLLPEDVQLWNLTAAPPPQTKLINGVVRDDLDFNVIYDSTHKWYSYRLSVGSVMDPIERHWRWHPDQVHRWIDLPELARLLQHYVGTHDFRAFATAVERTEALLGGTLDTVRTVRSVDVVHEGGDHYRIDFVLEGALYKQIRNMVGTILDVCKGRLSEEAFLELLQSGRSRDDNRSKPAPPEGLTLERVYFDDEDSF